MLARNQRLPRQRIEYLFKKGKKTIQRPFILKYFPTAGPFSRFCVIVSVKTAAKAVKRNLLRRRVHEIIRLHQKILKRNYDMILVSTAEIADRTYQELEKSIVTLFKTL